MPHIVGSVGRDGQNRVSDTKTVQGLLKTHRGALAPTLTVDGRVGPKTISAIERFQRQLGMRPDGRVDPNGRSLRALSASGSKPGPGAVVYSASVSGSKRIVSRYSMSVISMALARAGMPRAVVTSTIRTPKEQAAIMLRNAKVNLPGQLRLYGATGDEVLKVYKTNKKLPDKEVLALMVAKIEDKLKLGKRTSKHVVTPSEYARLNIIDIGVNSTRAACGAANFKPKAFTAALNELKNEGLIERLIDETKKSNTCWHVEIKPMRGRQTSSLAIA